MTGLFGGVFLAGLFLGMVPNNGIIKRQQNLIKEYRADFMHIATGYERVLTNTNTVMAKLVKRMEAENDQDNR